MTYRARTNRNPTRDLTVIGARALDDAHMTWIAAEVASGDALNAWSHAAAPNQGAAYAAYRAAVDREEAAARDLQRLAELIGLARVIRPTESGS